MSGLCVVILFVFESIALCAGHGWVTSPPARNSKVGPKNGYCPHCGNGNGICGDGNQWPGGSDYLNFYNGPVVTWQQGGIVEIEVKITAHHKGHFEFSICDQVITSALSNPQACLDTHILERATAIEAGVTTCAQGDKRAAIPPHTNPNWPSFGMPVRAFPFWICCPAWAQIKLLLDIIQPDQPRGVMGPALQLKPSLCVVCCRAHFCF